MIGGIQTLYWLHCPPPAPRLAFPALSPPPPQIFITMPLMAAVYAQKS